MNYAKTGMLFAAMLSLLITPAIVEDAFAAERIPAFMKQNIEWFAAGHTSEEEFINALTYLINVDVIVLDQARVDAIKELRDENERLRNQHMPSFSSREQSVLDNIDPQKNKTEALLDTIEELSKELEKLRQEPQKELQQEQKQQKPSKEPAALDVGFVRVTDESTKTEMLIVLPSPTFTGDVGDAYFLAALSSLSMKNPTAVEGKWSEFVANLHTGDIPMDINAIIQWVLRDSYLETNKDLQFYADKVKFYNDQKQAVRDHLTELREQRSQLGYSTPTLDTTTGTPKESFSPIREIPVGKGEPEAVSRGLDSLENKNESSMAEFLSIQKQYDSAEANVFEIATQVQANLDAKTTIREDISELRDIISDDIWPVKFTYHENGNEVTVVLSSKNEAENLLKNLEQYLQTLLDMSQQLQLQLQDAMNKQQQAMQMLSSIMKSQHDALKTIINNMRG